MKYAIPVSGGMVSAHFGHCEHFALFDVEELAPAPEHQPGLLPAWLAEQGVSLVIAGGMGSHAQSLFQQHRIGVVIGVSESDPEKAVLSYLEGKLAGGDNICDH